MAGIGRLSIVALDCPDPEALARFYAAVSGWEIDRITPDWIQLCSDIGITLAFQLAPEHRPPTWPADGTPQQVHLDFDVDDLDIGEAQVLALGARKCPHQPSPKGDFRVYLDPAGHPFCLVLAGANPVTPSAND